MKFIKLTFIDARTDDVVWVKTDDIESVVDGRGHRSVHTKGGAAYAVTESVGEILTLLGCNDGG